VSCDVINVYFLAISQLSGSRTLIDVTSWVADEILIPSDNIIVLL